MYFGRITYLKDRLVYHRRLKNSVSRLPVTKLLKNRMDSLFHDNGKNIECAILMLDNYKDLNKMPVLRRNNRIRSIHSSLAIEANSLSFDQVKDIIDGKIVIGPQDEIQEVKNAYEAYKLIKTVNRMSRSNKVKLLRNKKIYYSMGYGRLTPKIKILLNRF